MTKVGLQPPVLTDAIDGRRSSAHLGATEANRAAPIHSVARSFGTSQQCQLRGTFPRLCWTKIPALHWCPTKVSRSLIEQTFSVGRNIKRGGRNISGLGSEEVYDDHCTLRFHTATTLLKEAEHDRLVQYLSTWNRVCGVLVGLSWFKTGCANGSSGIWS